MRGDGKIAKAVEAIGGCHPDIAFSILEERFDHVARQAVRLRENIYASLMRMQETAIQRPYPQAAFAVAEQLLGLELLRRTQERIRLELPVDQSSDSFVRAGQKHAAVVFAKRSNVVPFARHRIELRRTRFPAPEPAKNAHPKIGFGVLIQIDHSCAKAAVFTVATDVAILNCAEPPTGTP